LKLSVGGTIVGVVLAAVMIFFLVYVPSLAASLIKSSGASVSGTLSSIFQGGPAIVLACALAVLVAAQLAIKDAPKVKGILKVLQGAVVAVYYYIILGGGTVVITAIFSNFELDLTVTLLITLALLEISAVMKMLQGIFEFREGPKPAKGTRPTVPSQPVPPVPT
jgi:hypothetical protein